jgi:DNA invertase Pin-like site-specific DNA recombinase
VTAPYPDTSQAPGDLLAPEPAVRTGALIGYARISTSGQLLDRQQHALAEASCIRVFADKLSGKNADRPELAALDITTPGGRLVFHVFAALAEFIRELIVEGTREGLDTARARGARLGRPPAMTAEQIRHARDLLTRPDNTVSSIARLLGVSRATIYKYVREVTTGRAAPPYLPDGSNWRATPCSRESIPWRWLPGWPSSQE